MGSDHKQNPDSSHIALVETSNIHLFPKLFTSALLYSAPLIVDMVATSMSAIFA